MPGEFGNWHTIYVRLNRWAKAGVPERVARDLQGELLADLDCDTLSLDSTIIPVHTHGTSALTKGGARKSAACAACPRLGPVSGHPALVMDRAYEDDATRRLAAELGYQPVVPPKSNRRRPWAYDRRRYRRRNEVERFFCRLKRFRRIAFRYDKLDIIFLSAIHLVLIYDMLFAI